MKIGYPCINRSLPCRGNKTFRLKSYTPQRLIETIDTNLSCLKDMLTFNLHHNILFFRISSDLVPFASHPICTFPWQSRFQDTFQELGEFITRHDIRISMHPDQFTLLNSPDTQIFQRSITELHYHAQVLDLMGLDTPHKIQIHVGGVYGNKQKSIRRFIKRYHTLNDSLIQRLVIENDDRSYTLQDCTIIHDETGIPILLDTFHHHLNNQAESLPQALNTITATCKNTHGIPMVDYSSQQPHKRPGKHAETINTSHFTQFLEESRPHDCDIMLEIKDKEISALKAIQIATPDARFHPQPGIIP